MKTLVACDCSYFYYWTLYGCLKEWQTKFPDDAAYWIKPPEETDQENLPDLLGCESFKRVLKLFVMKRLESVEYYAKRNFQDQLDASEQIDFVFAMDSSISNSFRKQLYPAYKLQRQVAPKSFCNWKIRDYVFNVLFKELEVEEKYGYKFVKVEGAEGDDVIATLFMKCAADYDFKILIASDKDFVQLDGVQQINMAGKEVKCELAGEKVTPAEFLLAKIILGDASDNIAKVFKGVGPKKALKLVRDKNALSKRLHEDQAAANQFLLNRKLISFAEIPEDMSCNIAEHINKALYVERPVSKHTFANLEWL